MEKPPKKSRPIEEVAAWYDRTWSSHRNRPSWPFFPSDWSRNPHVRRMSDREYRQYHLALCDAWSGPLMDREVQRMEQPVRERFVQLPSGDWQHPKILRQVAELEGERGRSNRRKTGGKTARKTSGKPNRRTGVLPGGETSFPPVGHPSPSPSPSSEPFPSPPPQGGEEGGAALQCDEPDEAFQLVEEFFRYELATTESHAYELGCRSLVEALRKVGTQPEDLSAWRDLLQRKHAEKGVTNAQSLVRSRALRNRRAEDSGLEKPKPKFNF